MVAVSKKKKENIYKRFLASVSLFVIILSFQNCTDFESHNLGAEQEESLSGPEIITKGQSLYVQNCASCHGPIDTSSKIGKDFNQVSWSVNNIPQMEDLKSLSSKQLSYISKALIFQSEGAGIELNDEGRSQFICDQSQRSKSSLLKLTNREFKNSLNALIDSFNIYLKQDSLLNVFYQSLPDDTVMVKGHTQKEQAKLVSQDILVGFFEASYRAATVITNSNSLGAFPNTNGCMSNSVLDQNCHKLFLKELMTQAFRKKIEDTDVEQMNTDLWDSSLSKIEQIQTTFTTITSMPEFLYKSYYHGDQIYGTNTYELSSYDLAAKVSYFLVGNPPDEILRGLASSDQIKNQSVLEQQIDRLLNTTAAQETIVRLFRESYGYEIFEAFNYPGVITNAVDTNALMPAMTYELDQFFINQVLQRDAQFQSLFTSTESKFNHNGLATIYGVNNPMGATTQLPSERAGFLNRAGMLTKRSGLQTSSIKRGLKVLENVLCVDVGPPPPSAPTSLPELGNDIFTTREHTFMTSEASGTSCATCHSRINPLGYAFENFDTIGRLRSNELIYDLNEVEIGSLSVDTAAETSELNGQRTSFSNSTDLSSQLGESDRASLCFVKHLKEFESRNEVTTSDYCHMNESLNVLYGDKNTNSGSIKDVIKSFVLSQSFRTWSY